MRSLAFVRKDNPPPREKAANGRASSFGAWNAGSSVASTSVLHAASPLHSWCVVMAGSFPHTCSRYVFSSELQLWERALSRLWASIEASMRSSSVLHPKQMSEDWKTNWECIELPLVDFPVSIHCGIWHSVLAGCGNHNLLLAGHRFLHLHGSVLVDQGIGCCCICNLHSPGKKFPILVFCSHPSSLLACST